MIVVDTSVWIDVLNRRDSPEAERCINLLLDGAPVALTDVIYAELLQGTASDDDAARLDDRLRHFDVLRLRDLNDFRAAAALYRAARASGHTIRHTLDCLIAAVCIRENALLLHRDNDFDRLALCSALRVMHA